MRREIMRTLPTVLSVTAALLLTGAARAQDAKKTPKIDADKIFAKLDADGDGKVTKAEFKKLTELGQGQLKERAKLLDKGFEKLDVNADGSLSKEEFAKFGTAAKKLAGAVKPQAVPASLKDAEGTFKKLDVDKDGKVTKEEFVKLAEQANLPKLKERLEPLFGRLDADANGALSLDEFKKFSELAQKVVKKINK